MTPQELASRIGRFQQDITNKIERLEALEDRLSVSLSGLSAFYDLDCAPIPIRVRGEFRSTAGLTIEHRVKIEIAAYDPDDRVIATGSTTIWPEHFHGLHTFEVLVFPSVPQISKIRIYPKKC